MVRVLGEVLPAGGQVLVIDDNSPDGTGEVADRLAADLDYVGVLHRGRKEDSAARTATASARRSRTAPISSSRWTATSHTTPLTSP